MSVIHLCILFYQFLFEPYSFLSSLIFIFICKNIFFCIETIIRMDDNIDIYQDVSMLKLKRMNYIWFYF